MRQIQRPHNSPSPSSSHLLFQLGKMTRRVTPLKTRRALTLTFFILISICALSTLLVIRKTSLKPPWFPSTSRTQPTLSIANVNNSNKNGNNGNLCHTRMRSNTIVHSSNITKTTEPPFQVIVLTFDRTLPLLRCLRSARAADYRNFVVDLHVWVDRSADENTASSNVITAASSFEWPHGAKYVHVWDEHVGICGQWIDSYIPPSKPLSSSLSSPSALTSLSSRAVILEDDLEVSPLYFRWLQGAVQSYSSKQHQQLYKIFGYTLQRGTLRARPGRGRYAAHMPLSITASEKAYFYLLVGSWGYSPDPDIWRSFREWYHTRSCDSEFKPYVKGLLPTFWYKKQEKHGSMWTMWHIRYAQELKLYTVYANLADKKTLAANWRERGLHYNESSKGEAAKIGQKDFEVLDWRQDTAEGRGEFKYPLSPSIVGWSGYYKNKEGKWARY